MADLQTPVQAKVWSNAVNVTRFSGPTADPKTAIDNLNPNQIVTVLTYSHGDTKTFKNPFLTNTSDAWDFVVTGPNDPGGFVPDVFIDTGTNITKQLAPIDAYGALVQHLASHQGTVRQGTVWANAEGVTRFSGPTADPTTAIDNLNPGQSVTVLCYTLAGNVSFQDPQGIVNTSDAWDFVVTSYQDPGGFVPDVFINTNGGAIKLLGPQGTCGALVKRLAVGPPPAQG